MPSYIIIADMRPGFASIFRRRHFKIWRFLQMLMKCIRHYSFDPEINTQKPRHGNLVSSYERSKNMFRSSLKCKMFSECHILMFRLFEGHQSIHSMNHALLTMDPSIDPASFDRFPNLLRILLVEC